MKTTDEARTAAIFRLGTKLIDRTAGLDKYDATIMIVEVNSPDQAGWIDLIGERLIDHPHVRPDGSTCIRVRAIIEADVRVLLKLDEPGARILDDVALASRRVVPIREAPSLALAGYAHRGPAARSVR